MASKTFLLLALAFVVVLLVSSQIADAKDLDDASQVEDAKYGRDEYNNEGGHGGYNNDGGRDGYGGDGGRGRCYHGCCRSYRYQRGCYKCCNTAAEAAAYKQAHEAKTRN